MKLWRENNIQYFFFLQLQSLCLIQNRNRMVDLLYCLFILLDLLSSTVQRQAKCKICIVLGLNIFICLNIFVYSCLRTGGSDCVLVKQPLDLLVNLTDDVKISCEHDDGNLDVMLWYQRRRESTTLDLISYNYNTGAPTYEPEYATRFKHNRISTLTGDLTISNLSQSDSAVYYCAARRHSASVSSPAWLKTDACRKFTHQQSSSGVTSHGSESETQQTEKQTKVSSKLLRDHYD